MRGSWSGVVCKLAAQELDLEVEYFEAGRVVLFRTAAFEYEAQLPIFQIGAATPTWWAVDVLEGIWDRWVDEVVCDWSRWRAAGELVRA